MFNGIDPKLIEEGKKRLLRILVERFGDDPRTRDGRRLLIKRLYILQEITGVGMGWHFQLGPNGVFSPSLDQDIVECMELSKTDEELLSMRDRAGAIESRLILVEEAVASPPTRLMSKDDWLDVFTLLHYFKSGRTNEQVMRQYLSRHAAALGGYFGVEGLIKSAKAPEGR